MVLNNMLQLTVVFSPHVQSRPFTTKKEEKGGGGGLGGTSQLRRVTGDISLCKYQVDDGELRVVCLSNDNLVVGVLGRGLWGDHFAVVILL